MRLATHGKRALKAAHIGFAGIWLGGLVCLVALLALARAGLGDRDSFGLYDAIYRIHDAVLYGAFLGTLATGLTFSLFTSWGFARHRWIAAKWALALVLFALTLIWQAPAVAGAVALADAGPELARRAELVAYTDRAFVLAGLQLAIVVVIFPISTWKPWGRWKRTFAVSKGKLRLAIGAGLLVAAGFGLFNYARLRRYRTLPLPQIELAAVADGRYRGTARCDFDYAVAVDVADGSIAAIEVERNRSSDYARFAEAVLPRIVAEQRVDVDAITGATTTSRCLMAAVGDALAQPATRGRSPSARMRD